MESWFSGLKLADHEDIWDMTMKLPCITKRSVTLDPYNMLWPAKWTAPLSGVIVVPHPTDHSAQVVLHKHIDFLETAGYHYNVTNPQDRESPSKFSLQLMQEEHSQRQSRKKTLDMGNRQEILDAIYGPDVDTDQDSDE